MVTLGRIGLSFFCNEANFGCPIAVLSLSIRVEAS